MAKFFGLSYVPKYQGNYFDLPWYKRYLLRDYDHLKYQEMAEDPNYYFKSKKVVNYDIINHEWRGIILKKTYK